VPAGRGLLRSSDLQDRAEDFKPESCGISPVRVGGTAETVRKSADFAPIGPAGNCLPGARR
jgi:hypothetical protein